MIPSAVKSSFSATKQCIEYYSEGCHSKGCSCPGSTVPRLIAVSTFHPHLPSLQYLSLELNGFPIAINHLLKVLSLTHQTINSRRPLAHFRPHVKSVTCLLRPLLYCHIIRIDHHQHHNPALHRQSLLQARPCRYSISFDNFDLSRLLSQFFGSVYRSAMTPFTSTASIVGIIGGTAGNYASLK